MEKSLSMRCVEQFGWGAGQRLALSAGVGPKLTSSVALVYSAASLRSKGAFLFSPAFFSAAVSVCRMMPT